MRELLTGNYAIAEAVRLAKAQLIKLQFMKNSQKWRLRGHCRESWYG